MGNPDVLEPARKAAIETETMADRDIGQITARDFLNILDKEGLGAASLNLMPEKKKYELYLEPEWTRAIRVKDLVRVIKAEKKKVELEVPFDPGMRVNPPYTNAGAYTQYATSAGGGGAYPNPDDPGRHWPPGVEIRKTSLDSRFDMVASQLAHQIAQLQLTVQDLRSRIDGIAHR